MKKVFLLPILLMLLTSACKKVIDLDLKTTSPSIVIEGELSNSEAAVVRVTKSVQFGDDNTFPAVHGAAVTITDEKGIHYTLAETGSGIYSNNLKGLPGHTYYLSVRTGTDTFTASSFMPSLVGLDSVRLQKNILFGKLSYTSIAYYFDPAGLGNYYKFSEKVNQKRTSNIWVWDDRILDGRQSSIPLFHSGDDNDIHVGDTVKVEMQCIDKNVHRYFTTLENVKTSNSVPANPDSNISGGALGYFSAKTTDTKQIIAKP